MTVAARHLLSIGIGAGDPMHLTLQAAHGLSRVDAFFLPDKGERTAALLRARNAILAEHAQESARIVRMPDPERDRPAAAADYRARVEHWRARRAERWAGFIRAELGPGETGAFLVWGDPALYDSTADILEKIQRCADPAITYEVIPGVSSLSALAASHRTTWTRVGEPVRITTGRMAVDCPGQHEDTLVLLNVPEAIDARRGENWWIYWGAYLGTPDELVVSGPLDEVADRIAQLRERARSHHGWIMDTCLLRRRKEDDQ